MQEINFVIVAGPEKKLRNIIFKKIPWKGSSKIEANHLPKKARISLNVCKLEDVSSTNTTKILIMIIMKRRNVDFNPAMLICMQALYLRQVHYSKLV